MDILIVEDELALTAALKEILQTKGHRCEAVQDGISALEYARSFPYDLIILDVMLPRLDGFSVVRRLREERMETPVLMLTARTATEDKVQGLNAGADDYLTKPFETEELLARVNALSRRSGSYRADELFCGDLVLELSTGMLRCGDGAVQLSRRELDVAGLLFSNPQRVLTKEYLIVRVWGPESDATDNNVEAYISFLRKKMRYLGSAVTIKNIQKIGYRLEAGPC